MAAASPYLRPQFRESTGSNLWVLVAFALVAFAGGLGYALAYGEMQAFFVAASLVAALAVLFDFRIGVVLLVLIMPIGATQLFPYGLMGVPGLNPTNLLIVATTLAFLMRGGRIRELAPAPVLWLMVVPVVLSGLLGMAHFDQIASYFFETAERWFRRRGGAQGSGTTGHAVLFTTCSVNYSDPVVARSAVAVLEHAGVKVEIVYERCCGMPFTDTGDLDAARRNAARNVADLSPKVEAGAVILVPGPSCSLMLKEEYPRLLQSDAARRVAAATRDLMEYLYELARDKKLPREFRRPLGTVAYQAPCHLRHQKIGFRARDLLKLAGADVTLIDACYGVDGTWGMQARFHYASMAVAAPMLRRIQESGAEHVATDCPLSALRIEEGTGRKPVHPIVLLRHAYGLGAE